MCSNVLNYKVTMYKKTNYPCFRLNKAVSYVLPELSFNEALNLLKHIKNGFKNDIGTNLSDCDVMYNYVQTYLTKNNIKLNVINVEHKYYNEEFDEFLCDNYFKSY